MASPISELIVIAFDPGTTTGWALWNYPEGSESFGQGEWFRVADWLQGFLHAAQANDMDVEVVSESFVITMATLKKSRETSPIEMIGVIRWLTHKHMGKEITLYSPSSAKSFSTDHKLKQLGWYQKGKPHATDAARHLLLYLINKGLFTPRLIVPDN